MDVDGAAALGAAADAAAGRAALPRRRVQLHVEPAHAASIADNMLQLLDAARGDVNRMPGDLLEPLQDAIKRGEAGAEGSGEAVHVPAKAVDMGHKEALKRLTKYSSSVRTILAHLDGLDEMLCE